MSDITSYMYTDNSRLRKNMESNNVDIDQSETESDNKDTPVMSGNQAVQIFLENSTPESQYVVNDPNAQIVTEYTKRKLSYKWSPLKVAAVVVFVLAILAAFIGLISYSQAGKSSDVYGAPWIWVLFILSIILFFLATVLLGFG